MSVKAERHPELRDAIKRALDKSPYRGAISLDDAATDLVPAMLAFFRDRPEFFVDDKLGRQFKYFLPRWRVGRKLLRTLYRDECCVGMVDTPDLAAEIVEALNGARRSLGRPGRHSHASKMSNEEISQELARLTVEWNAFRDGLEVDDGMAGSPGEWMVERMDELETEQRRRMKLKEGKTT